MRTLEQAVRDSLARAAATMPALTADPAGRAIRRGRRVRHRQTFVGALAVITTTALASGALSAVHNGAVGTWGMGPPPPPTGDVTATASVGRTVPPVDIVVGDVLRTAVGTNINLTGLGTVTAGFRAGAGWLLLTGDGTRTLSASFASDSAPLRALVSGPDIRAVTVDESGGRIAWQAGTSLSIAAVDAGQLGTPVQTQVAPEVVPVGFVGGGVRLARLEPSGRISGQDVWFPQRGPYTARWDNQVTGVYGALPDGLTMVGQVPASDNPRERCLALLDVSTSPMQVTKRACGLGLTTDARGWISPAGRWLVAEVSTGASEPEAALIDLNAVFGSEPRTVRVGSAPRGGAAWENPDTVVRASGAALQRLRLDRLWAGLSGGTEELALADVPDGVTLVVIGQQPL